MKPQHQRSSVHATGRIGLALTALLLTTLTPAQAISDAGVLDVSGISTPDLVTIDNPQVSYDSEADAAFICMTVLGLEEGQSGTLSDVSVDVASDTVNDTFVDAQTYGASGYDDGQGAIVGDLCVTLPADVNGLIDPVAFDSIAVSGTFDLDAGDGGGTGGGTTGGGSIGTVENGFDLTGITGPDGASVSNPTSGTDEDSGVTSICFELRDVTAEAFAYLRNVTITIDSADVSGDYPDPQGYVTQAYDNGDGSTTGTLCIPVGEEIATVVADQTFNSLAISGDVYVPTVDVSIDDTRETGLTVDNTFASSYETDSGSTSGCFNVSNLPEGSAVYLTNIQVTATQQGEDFTVQLADHRFEYTVDNEGTDCLEVNSGPDGSAAELGDLQMADSIVLTAEAHFASTITDSFKTYLSSKGILLKDIDVARRGSGAVVVATMKPKLRKTLHLAPARLKFGSITLTPLQKAWVLPSGQDTNFELGYSATNFTIDMPNTPVTATLTALTPSTLKTTTLKLPKGLSVADSDPALWFYKDPRPGEYDALYDGKTSPCIELKNSTSKAITVDLDFVWKIGAKRIANSGTHYVQIPARDTNCVSGIEEWNPFLVTGDIRFGATVTVSGTATVVTATSLKLSVTKPAGFTVTTNPAFWNCDSGDCDIIEVVSYKAGWLHSNHESSLLALRCHGQQDICKPSNSG